MLIRPLRRLARAVVLSAVLPIVPPLSLDQQQAIADAFAPTFVFHQAETFFPVSPLFPETSEAMRSPRLRGTAAVTEALGSSGQREATYRGWPLEDKIRAAAVTYRVYTLDDAGRSRVIVEYWCHYVFNDYTVRLGWLPVRFPAAHQHDLESVRVVLTRRGVAEWDDHSPTPDAARARFSIVDIVASAHAGSVPPNRATLDPAAPVNLPIHMLVERGSHAMAADLNRDGRFTPRVDSSNTETFVWGIRDQGSLGLRYRDAFSDSRAGPDLVRLCGPSNGEDAPADLCSPYRLERADDIDAWFRDLQMTRSERHAVHGSSGWVAPVFIDRDHKDLLLPPARRGGDAISDAMRRPETSERGWFAGLTTSNGKPTVVIGRQHALITPGRSPDWFFDGGFRSSGSRPVGTASVAATYPLDAITRLVVSTGWLSDAQRAAGARFDTFAGAQFRIGHIRVRSGYRVGVRAFDTVVFGLFAR